MFCGIWGLLIRWIINNRKRLTKFNEFRDNWLLSQSLEPGKVPDDKKKLFTEYCLSSVNWSDKRYAGTNGKRVKIEYNIRDYKFKTIMECFFAPFDIMSYVFG